MERIAAIILGLSFIIFSYPQIRMPIMNRLFNEGYVTPKRVKPEDAEIIRYIGPSGSLFAIGFILLILGVFFL